MADEVVGQDQEAEAECVEVVRELLLVAAAVEEPLVVVTIVVVVDVGGEFGGAG